MLTSCFLGTVHTLVASARIILGWKGPLNVQLPGCRHQYVYLFGLCIYSKWLTSNKHTLGAPWGSVSCPMTMMINAEWRSQGLNCQPCNFWTTFLSPDLWAAPIQTGFHIVIDLHLCQNTTENTLISNTCALCDKFLTCSNPLKIVPNNCSIYFHLSNTEPFNRTYTMTGF